MEGRPAVQQRLRDRLAEMYWHRRAPLTGTRRTPFATSLTLLGLIFAGCSQCRAPADTKPSAPPRLAPVVMVPAAVPDEIPVFRADHPFLFFISDTHSGAVLFIGRVSDPSRG
jgi:hypothetical protein